MAKTSYESVNEYMAAQPTATKRVLARVRTALRKALPGTEEVISYQIPAYKLNGKAVVFFAGWKEHFSLYPATPRVCDVLASELAPYEVSKGTIRFPLASDAPLPLIARIAKLRAEEVAEAETARRKAPAKRRGAGTRASANTRGTNAKARTTRKTSGTNATGRAVGKTSGTNATGRAVRS